MSRLDVPSEVDPNGAYEDTLTWYRQHAAAYAAKIAGVEPPEIRKFDQWLPDRSRVLDIGCAAGRDTVFLGQRHWVTGVDITPEMIELARRKGGNCSFIVGDSTRLAFDNDTFDGLCLRSVLLHLPADLVPIALGEVRRVGKNGARTLVRVKKRWGDDRYVIGGREVRTSSTRLFHLFTPEEIAADMQKAGFVIDELEEAPDDDHSEVVCLNVFAHVVK